MNRKRGSSVKSGSRAERAKTAYGSHVRCAAQRSTGDRVASRSAVVHRADMAGRLSGSTLGDRIRALRDERGMNNSSLARKSGVGRSKISRALNHGAHLTQDDIACIAKALSVEPTGLVPGLPPATLNNGRKQCVEVLVAENLRLAEELKSARAEQLAASLRAAELESIEAEHLAERGRFAQTMVAKDKEIRDADSRAAWSELLLEAERASTTELQREVAHWKATALGLGIAGIGTAVGAYYRGKHVAKGDQQLALPPD